jgi:hypothetical protein
MQNTYNNFGELYRSAFAERDPQKKLELLSAVRRVIDEWETTTQESSVARPESGRKRARTSDTPARLSIVA